MTLRMSTKTVTFLEPFNLRGLERELSAGDYTVETQEELIEGLSFPAYRRVLTQIRLSTVPGHSGQEQTFKIDPRDLNGVLAHEGDTPRASDKKKSGHG